jgi:hypothetical protein
MELKVSTYSVIYILLNIAIVAPLWLLLDRDCNVYITFAAVIQLLISIRMLRKVGIPYLSLQILFVILSTLFHFGEAYLLAIGRTDLFDYTNIDLAGSISIYNLSNIFALLVQALVVFGILNVNKTFKNEKRLWSYVENNEKNELSRVYRIGIILFCIGIIPNFLYYYSQVSIILKGGIYSGIRSAINYGPLFLLALFYRPGIFMLLIGSKNHKWRARIVTIFGVMSELFFMLSGNRAQQLLMIISFFFIYYRVISKITFTRVVIFSGIGYFSAVLLYFISAYRNFNIFDLTTISDRFMGVLEGGALYDLLSQLGSNLNVVVLSLVSIPSYHSYNFGLTYIISWLSIYPNTGGILGNIPDMYSFLNYLDTDLPLGGSYIGELYFNFGWLSLIAAVFIGWFIGTVGRKIEFSIVRKNWIKFSMYIVLFSQLLWWVRDYFSSWIYPFVWSSFAIYLLNKFIVERIDRKK